MTESAWVAEEIASDFYDRRLDFSERSNSDGGWSELPEIDIVPEGLGDARTVRLFLTFMAAMDKMVDAGRLWRAGKDLFHARPDLFDPTTASAMDLGSLGELLQQRGITRYHKAQTEAWRTIAPSLCEAKSAVCQVVHSGEGDADDLLRDLRSCDGHRRPRFPQLRGRKIGPMWVRMMAEPGGATIRRLERVPVAVDVQVRRVTENLGVADTRGLPLERAKPKIQDAWFAAVAAARGIKGPERLRDTCAALDPALWFFGKHGCSHCERVKRRVSFGGACRACQLPVPGTP